MFEPKSVLKKQATLLAVDSTDNEKDIVRKWMLRYGLVIRINLSVTLTILALIVLINTSLIESFYQMIATCITATLISIVIIIMNMNCLLNEFYKRDHFEILIGLPYLFFCIYFILQNIILSKNNDFNTYIFLLFYLCILIGTQIFSYVKYKHLKLFDFILLTIWNILAILKLFNFINNTENNNKLTIKHYILINVILFYSKVK